MDMLQKIADALQVDPGLVQPTTTAEDLPEWDSMGTMQIIFMLDNELNISLEVEDMQRVQSVQGVLEIVRETKPAR